MNCEIRLVDDQQCVEHGIELITQINIANVEYRKKKKRFTFALNQPQVWRIVLS